jgi:acyl-CoA dehydrogenase
MNLDFTDDQKMLKDIAAGFLKENAPLALVRGILESDASYSVELWKKCAAMGWQGTAIPEQYGGAGFGHLELAVIAEELGYSLAPIPFSSSVYLATEALLMSDAEATKQELLPKLASGDAIGAFALAERSGQNGLDYIAVEFDGSTVSGTKTAVVDGDIADFAVVVVTAAAGNALVLVDLTGPGVERKALTSIDPSRSVAQIVFKSAPAVVLMAGDATSKIERLLDRAAVLFAFEQIGAATRALEVTKQYTLERFAFGRPIGSFQAIKHTMADRWCDIELARSNGYYAAWALEHDNQQLGVAACLARIAASTAFDQMGIDMIQLHGGVGFTWEFDCHLFYRRSKLLSAALGTTSSWKHKLIERIDGADKEAA